MGYIEPAHFIFDLFTTNNNPVDSTTYLLGSINVFSTNPFLSRCYVNTNCRIVAVHLYWYNATVDASAENVTWNIRKNDTTDTAIYTGAMTNANAPQSITGLNITLNRGDYFQVKYACPAWVTNPTGQYLIVKVLIQTR